MPVIIIFWYQACWQENCLNPLSARKTFLLGFLDTLKALKASAIIIKFIEKPI